MSVPIRHRRSGWLGGWTLGMLGVVVAINLVGVWEIASGLHSLSDERRRALTLETAARARGLEGRVASVTADLAFLIGSAALREEERDDAQWAEHAGAALLLFLRGHPEVSALSIREGGTTRVEAGRPRGVPGFWMPESGSPQVEPRVTAVRRVFPVASRRSATDSRELVAVLEPGALISDEAGGPVAGCALRDTDGVLLAGRSDLGGAADIPPAGGEVVVADWGRPAPWRLSCSAAEVTQATALQPLVVRQRTLVVLNVLAMVLAAVLGVFAFIEATRRRQLESQAVEEARVRELERQLFHTERLATAGRLAAGIAHEVNNPLEGMANYLGLARDSLARGEPLAAARHLESARSGLDRAAGIVRRVLDHAEPSAALDEHLNLVEVVSRALEFVRERREFGAIEFSLEAPAGELPVRGSAAMLGQVLLNLLLNACEAQPNGGAVSVTCRRDGSSAVCAVADRGPGVPPASRERIFEPFESTKRSAGLGLSICHSIVRHHGGDLTVEDRPEGGSVFRVRLNAATREGVACA